MAVFDDPVFDVQRGEIFAQSQCIAHEQSMFNFFACMLTNLGWRTDDPARRVWRQANRSCVVCLADDFLVCGGDRNQPPNRWFSVDCTVITDNHITFDADYAVRQLPASYFGIYGYVPVQQDWAPDRALSLCVNRMDSQRVELVMALATASNGLENMLRQHLVNFNGYDPTGANHCVRDLCNNWDRCVAHVSHIDQTLAQQIRDHLPLRSHALSVETAHVRAYVNVVVETYAGDHTHAFSEKIFRALCTPAPWCVFSARGAVDYLRNLGFDVLEDLMRHDYDTWVHQGKIPKFIAHCQRTADRLRSMPVDAVAKRCRAAARHNQELLSTMRLRWPEDFARYLPDLLLHLRPVQ